MIQSVTIEYHKHGLLLRGGAHGIPIDLLTALSPLAGAEAVMALGVSTALRATLALAYNEESASAWKDEIEAGIAQRGLGSIAAWRAGTDTGTSSITLCDALEGKPLTRKSIPHDAGDFGRCVRMVESCGWTREQLASVRDHLAEKVPDWGPILDSWDGLVKAYQEQKPQVIYHTLKTLRGQS